MEITSDMRFLLLVVDHRPVFIDANYRVHSGQKGCGRSGGGVGEGGTVGTVSGFVYV